MSGILALQWAIPAPLRDHAALKVVESGIKQIFI